jgi:hypothetical protein
MLRKPVGRSPLDRDRIALALLQRARAGDPQVCAVWYGGGLGIQIKRMSVDLYPTPITWREAHRLAFPEEYSQTVQRKPMARVDATARRKTR